MSLPLNKVLDIFEETFRSRKRVIHSNLDSKLFAQKSKEYSNLNEIIKEAKEYTNYEKNKKDLDKIIEDADGEQDIIELAKSELKI